ncbi:MAG: tetratricopeptide repeat protein [Spirochaetota bacterium]
MTRRSGGRVQGFRFTFSMICSGLLILFGFTGCQTKPYQQELAETYYNLGNAYIELAQWDEAETAFARALEINAELYRAEYNMARVYINSGNYGSAVDILNKLLERDPENIIFLETLAWTRVKQGRGERAEEIYRSLLDSDPANCNARYNLALLLSDREEYAEAYSLLIDCVYGGSADWEILLKMGNLEKALDWGSGVGWFEKAEEKAPQEASVLRTLAAAYQQEGLHTQALDMYRRLAGRAEGPQRGEYLLEQARILYLQLEEKQPGQTALEGALEAGFKDTEALSEFYTAVVEKDDLDVLTSVEAELRRFELLEAIRAQE